MWALIFVLSLFCLARINGVARALVFLILLLGSGLLLSH